MKRTSICLVLFLAACGGDKATTDAAEQIDAAEIVDAPPPPPPVDAQTFDFSCAGAPLGAATATIAISGNTFTTQNTNLVAEPDVAVELRNNSNDSVLDSKTSDSAGAFAFAAQNTETKPLDVYVFGHKEGDVDGYVFPADPLVADLTGAPVPVISTSTISLIGVVTGVDQEAGEGFLVLQVQDCSGVGIGGATITLSQNGTDIDNPTVFDASSLSPQAAGAYFVENVDPATTTVKASISGMDLHAHDVKVFADSSTSTQLHP